MKNLKPYKVVGISANILVTEVNFSTQSEAQMYAQELRKRTNKVIYSVEVDHG